MSCFRILSAGILALVLGACQNPGSESAQIIGARANLVDPSGYSVGVADFVEGDLTSGVVIHVRAWGLTPGRHGMHIYALGSCEKPDFETAGGHFNPFGRKHGLKNPEGPHAGDLPNLTVGPDGRADMTVTNRLVTLRPGKNTLLGTSGTSLMIHADPDDEVTDPAGNSGPRIACGVIWGPPPSDINAK